MLCAASLGCGRGDQIASNQPVIDTLPGGIVRVHNLGPTRWADTSGWKLVLEHTIAPGQGQPGELSDPRDIVSDSRGRIFVVDRDPDIVIKVFGADGSYLMRFSRRGSGPGELEAAALMITQDTLVIHDSRLARTSIFTTDGHFVRVWPSSCCLHRALLATRGGVVPIPGAIAPDTTGGSTSRMFAGAGAIRHLLDGTTRDTLLFPDEPEAPTWRVGAKPNVSINTIPFTPGLVSRFAPDGSFIWGFQGRYQFVISRTGRDSVRLFDYTATPVPLADSLRREAMDEYTRADRRLEGVATLQDIPGHYPLWSSLAVDGDGNIWVLLPGPRGEGDHWHVFTPDGVLLGTVPAPFDAVRRTYWSTDRVYQIATDPVTDLPEIRVWRITRGGA
jgi:hypothetical protein